MTDGRQASLLIVAESVQTFKLHVTTLKLPFVVLLKQQGSNKANDGRIVGEDTDDAGPTFDLGVEPFQGIGGVDLSAMGLREVHEGQSVGFGVAHQRGELRKLLAQRIGNDPSLPGGGLGSVLREDGVDAGAEHLALGFARIGQDIAKEVATAALPARLKNPRDRNLESFVGIGDHQLDAPGISIVTDQVPDIFSPICLLPPARRVPFPHSLSAPFRLETFPKSLVQNYRHRATA